MDKYLRKNPLFNLNEFDLSATCMNHEDISNLNPQSGDMKHLDRVIWINEDATQGLGIKEIKENEFWVSGHIPGRPLFPGVLMIEAAGQLCSVVYQKYRKEKIFIGLVKLNNFSFRGTVRIGDSLYLMMQKVKFQKNIFICTAQGIVNNSVVFSGEITGMPV